MGNIHTTLHLLTTRVRNSGTRPFLWQTRMGNINIKSTNLKNGRKETRNSTMAANLWQEKKKKGIWGSRVYKPPPKGVIPRV